MNQDIAGLYMQLNDGLLNIRSSAAGAMEQAEESFRLALAYWFRVKQLLETHDFCSVQEEVYFFKIIKPGFTSAIELSVLQYCAHLFSPADDEQASIAHWKNEIARAGSFFRTHEGFLHYYLSGRTTSDEDFFCRSKTVKHQAGFIKSYPESARTYSPRDHLVCLLKAFTGYLPYAIMQLGYLQNKECRPSPAFIPPVKNQTFATGDSLFSFTDYAYGYSVLNSGVLV